MFFNVLALFAYNKGEIPVPVTSHRVSSKLGTKDGNLIKITLLSMVMEK